MGSVPCCSASNLAVTLTASGRGHIYEIMEEIGTGHHGPIYRVMNVEDGEFYACKVVLGSRLQAQDLQRVSSETEILRSLSAGDGHPFIVKLHESFEHRSKQFLIMDYYGNGDLEAHHRNCRFVDPVPKLTPNRHMSESRVKLYAAELFMALCFMHSKNLIYRDLKPSNVLLDDDGHCVVIDFNFSRIIRSPHDRATSGCGTTLLFGNLPFDDTDSEFDYYCNVMNGRYQLPTDSTSPACQDFIRKCLQPLPEERIHTKGIVSHPWFEEFNWGDIHDRWLRPEPSFPELKEEVDPETGAHYSIDSCELIAGDEENEDSDEENEDTDEDERKMLFKEFRKGAANDLVPQEKETEGQERQKMLFRDFRRGTADGLVAVSREEEGEDDDEEEEQEDGRTLFERFRFDAANDLVPREDDDTREGWRGLNEVTNTLSRIHVGGREKTEEHHRMLFQDFRIGRTEETREQGDLFDGFSCSGSPADSPSESDNEELDEEAVGENMYFSPTLRKFSEIEDDPIKGERIEESEEALDDEEEDPKQIIRSRIPPEEPEDEGVIERRTRRPMRRARLQARRREEEIAVDEAVKRNDSV